MRRLGDRGTSSLRGDGHRGQSLVEFALVLPMLLVLLLGIADFGRVFSAGIILEASARNAAEIVALERLHNVPPPASDPGFAMYYSDLHAIAANTACEESRRLPTFRSSDACPDGAHDGNGDPAWFVRACVHDGADPACDQAISGYGAAVPAACDSLVTESPNTFVDDASYYVEVRLCYKFETLFNLDLSLPMGAGLSLGDIWLERTRTFVIDCPTGPDPRTACPNPS